MKAKTKFKKTLIGEIPEDWEVIRIRDIIIEVKPGFASGKRDENGIIQLRMNNITTDGRVVLDEYLKVPIPKNVENYLLKPGDVLFNNTNSVDLIGKTAIFRGECDFCTYSNHITRIRVKQDVVIPEWVMYYFIKLWSEGYFRQICVRHVGQAGIRKENLLNTKIPLPPLPEQKKIAGILRTVDEAIEKTDLAIEKTERLKKGLMQRLLTKGIKHERFKKTEIGEIPEDWEVVRLKDIADKMYYGITAKAIENMSSLRMLRTTDIKNYKISWKTLPYCEITEKRKDIKKYFVQKDDLIIARAGTVGVSVLVEENVSNVIFGSYLIKVVLKKDKVYPRFIHYYFQSDYYWRHIQNASSGSTLKNINLPILRSLKIPLPPLEEQKQIAEILMTVDKKLELLRKRKEKLERIKKGLMKDLLTGRRRVKA